MTHDGRRDALWKSALGSTGGYGCERATFYGETIRGPDGRRIPFAASEPVIFGIALDRMHRELMEQESMGTDGEALFSALSAAVRAGIEVARGRLLAEPWSEGDWHSLALSVGLAGEKLVGLWPNRTRDPRKGSEEHEVLPEPEGTPPGPPLGWLAPGPDGVLTAQEKLYAPGVAGGRGLSGQPDYLVKRDGRIVGWWDVKAPSRSASYPAKWTQAEACAYDLLCTVSNGGTCPEWHGYLEYRRVAKPYWAVTRAPVDPSSVILGEAYLRRWERALDVGDPDALSFSPSVCAGCQWREPMPDTDHPGCHIGAAVVRIAPPDSLDKSTNEA